MKIWQIKGIGEKLSEDDLIKLIKSNKVKKDDILLNTELDIEVKLEETIYSFYMRNENE